MAGTLTRVQGDIRCKVLVALSITFKNKICARVYLFPQCTIDAQDLHKIVLISPMRNICTRFAQDCTYFSNAQYMCKVCARLYLFPQCAIYAQDCTYFSNAQYMHKICARLYLFLQCAIYAQDLPKIVLISPTPNICARLYLISNLKC